MESAAAGKRVTLLYVEDDADIQERIISILDIKFPQIALFMAKNGQIGLDLYQKHRPDIVLTDIRMPVMDGIQMSREIKRVDKSAQIIVLTADCETDSILEAIDIGIS